VQLAKWGGARVIATVSSSLKAEQARLAGADLVIDYKTEDVVARTMAFTEQRGVDRVVDVDFGGNIATTLRLMAMNSTPSMPASTMRLIAAPPAPPTPTTLILAKVSIWGST